MFMAERGVREHTMYEPRPTTATILCPSPMLSNAPLWALESDLTIMVNAAIRFPITPLGPWRWMLNDRDGWDRLSGELKGRNPELWCPRWKQQPGDEVYEDLDKLFIDFETMRNTITWAPYECGWPISTMTRCIACLVEEGWKRIDIVGCQLDGMGYYGTDIEKYSSEERWRGERRALNVLIKCGDDVGVTIRRI